jgi:hypothetical protein
VTDRKKDLRGFQGSEVIGYHDDLGVLVLRDLDGWYWVFDVLYGGWLGPFETAVHAALAAMTKREQGS